MQVLFQGIWNAYNGNAALKAVVTGMYLTEAPQGAVYPYIVYHLISNVPNWTFTEDAENTLIQFNIYDDSSSSTTINDIYDKLTALYNWATLTVTGYSSIYVKREFNNLTRVNDIWSWVTQYRIEIQK